VSVTAALATWAPCGIAVASASVTKTSGQLQRRVGGACGSEVADPCEDAPRASAGGQRESERQDAASQQRRGCRIRRFGGGLVEDRRESEAQRQSGALQREDRIGAGAVAGVGAR
jgi:hypothetical protein